MGAAPCTVVVCQKCGLFLLATGRSWLRAVGSLRAVGCVVWAVPGNTIVETGVAAELRVAIRFLGVLPTGLQAVAMAMANVCSEGFESRAARARGAIGCKASWCAEAVCGEWWR